MSLTPVENQNENQENVTLSKNNLLELMREALGNPKQDVPPVQTKITPLEDDLSRAAAFIKTANAEINKDNSHLENFLRDASEENATMVKAIKAVVDGSVRTHLLGLYPSIQFGINNAYKIRKEKRTGDNYPQFNPYTSRGRGGYTNFRGRPRGGASYSGWNNNSNTSNSGSNLEDPMDFLHK